MKESTEQAYFAYLSNRTPRQLVVEGTGDLRISLPPLASRIPVTWEQWCALDPDVLRKSSTVGVTTWEEATSTDSVQFFLGIGSVVSFLLSWLVWIFYDLVAALAVYAILMTGFALLAEVVGTRPEQRVPASHGRGQSPHEPHRDVGPSERESMNEDGLAAKRPSEHERGKATRVSRCRKLQRRLGLPWTRAKSCLSDWWSERDHPDLSQVLRGATDTLVPTVVVVIGFGTAMAVSYYVVTGNPMAQVFEAGRVAALASDQGSEFILHTLRTLCIGTLVTFPAGLYYMFERQRGEALRTRFLLDLFRLDSRLRTVDDVRARYGDRMKDVFGDETDPTAVVAKRRGLRYNLPILVCTVVLTLAAVVIYVPLGPDLDQIPAAGADWAIATVLPVRHIFSFGLLGAYFYALNLTVRGYVRGDLQPKTYSQVSARILQVLAISAVIWVLYLVTAPESQATSAPIESDAAWALLLAFFAGVVPDTILTAVYERMRQAPWPIGLVLGRDDLTEKQPLTELEGVDLYDRARLEQEGVTNLEALVHGELVDLMIQTRIPAGRLVDWMDQALLLLYTKGVESDTPGDTPSGGKDLAGGLRGRGIRTASQLLSRMRSPDFDGDPYLSHNRPPIATAALGIGEEPCMRRIKRWKQNCCPGRITVKAPAKGISAVVGVEPVGASIMG